MASNEVLNDKFCLDLFLVPPSFSLCYSENLFVITTTIITAIFIDLPQVQVDSHI